MANSDYGSVEDLLDGHASRKRKAIRKDRRTVAESGVTLSTLTGADITPAHWDAFFRFYRDTSDRKWGPAYLNREFFSRLGQTMADSVVLVMAEADGGFVGGALNLMGGGVLYGRYWGCVKDYRFLHFEACYYRAIDFAIANGLTRVEAAPAGPPNGRRGYQTRRTQRAHWDSEPGCRAINAGYLGGERKDLGQELEGLARHTPLRQGLTVSQPFPG